MPAWHVLATACSPGGEEVEDEFFICEVVDGGFCSVGNGG